MSEKAFPLADAELTIALQDLIQVSLDNCLRDTLLMWKRRQPSHMPTTYYVTASQQLQTNQKGCQRSYQNTQSWYFRAHHHGCRCGAH